MTMSAANLMKAIQMYDFCLYDLNLFLDTHPNDRNALAKFNEITKKRNKAYEMYIEKYGPVIAVQNNSDERFNWVDDPWPWERGAN